MLCCLFVRLFVCLIVCLFGVACLFGDAGASAVVAAAVAFVAAAAAALVAPAAAAAAAAAAVAPIATAVSLMLSLLHLPAAVLRQHLGGLLSTTIPGYNRMSVYSYEGGGDDSVEERGYQGCYRDSKRARVMGDKRTDSAMTNEVSPLSPLHKRFLGPFTAPNTRTVWAKY